MCITNIEVSAESIVSDISLQVEPVNSGIKFPTNMEFLRPQNILILEKNQGTVRRILNDSMLDEPLLDVKMAKKQKECKKFY